jgi:nitrile hydratase subunit beta
MSFVLGEQVRVSARPHRGHHRTPGYLKGKTGTVERVHGRFLNPETRAYGEGGEPVQRLYLVAFEPTQLWPAYRGGSRDRVLADVFEHWLERQA